MTEEKLKKLVTDLGDTPQEIAKKLTELGCKGSVGEHDRCPIANYLRTKGAFYISVAEANIEAYDEEREAEITTPVAAQAFIEMFDQGKFKELEE